MKLRAISRVSVVALVIIVGVVIFVHGQLAGGKTSLVGADLGATAAPGFSLADQSGVQVSLAGQHGHPVALLFLDTQCAGSCAQLVEKVHSAMTMLGQKASQVRWVAVSVDPAHDTAQTASAFVTDHQLAGNLRYLVGSQSQLAPVWKAYGVTAPSGTNAGQAPGGWPGVFLIDDSGRERVYLDSGFDPSALASDLKALLA